jgi:hypothetical protein
MEKQIQIPYSLYARLVEHLSAHSDTDDWARSLLEELEEEKKEVEIDLSQKLTQQTTPFTDY